MWTCVQIQLISLPEECGKVSLTTEVIISIGRQIHCCPELPSMSSQSGYYITCVVDVYKLGRLSHFSIHSQTIMNRFHLLFKCYWIPKRGIYIISKNPWGTNSQTVYIFDNYVNEKKKRTTNLHIVFTIIIRGFSIHIVSKHMWPLEQIEWINLEIQMKSF